MEIVSAKQVFALHSVTYAKPIYDFILRAK